jgi:hypothetical protein
MLHARCWLIDEKVARSSRPSGKARRDPLSREVRFAHVLLLVGSLSACAVERASDAESVSVVSAALSACDETVPANRNVDGIPAYAQCAASMNSAIYSNNGVDTSLTQTGSDWVRTQYSGGYQCTEFAHRYLYFKWQVKWIPNGNAGTWCDTVPPSTSGLVQATTPVHGDLMVLAPGSCGADNVAGHVNVIDVVGTQLTAVEQNGARRGNYQASCAKCFLHVVANDGMSSGAGGTAGSAGSAAGGAGRSSSTAGAPAGLAGMTAPPVVTPQSQAGAAAPAPTNVPPPVVTPAAAMMPAATPPVSAGVAGAPVFAPTTGVAPQARPADNEGVGCSVTRVADSKSNAFAMFAFAAICARVVRRSRRAR